MKLSVIYTPRSLKPHSLGVVCFVLGFKSPLQNVIMLAELLWSAKRVAPQQRGSSPEGSKKHYVSGAPHQRGITNYELRIV